MFFKNYIPIIFLWLAITAGVAAYEFDHAERVFAMENEEETANISAFLIPEDEKEITQDQVSLSGLLIPDEKIISETITEEKLLPQVLIYHTHTTEAFRMTAESEYKETSEWRTNDENFSVVALGKLLTEEMEKHGFAVTHDRTDHEPPKLSSSYERSLLTMEKRSEENPELSLFIDLHRDAANIETAQDDFVMIDGKECARIMFVVGKGEKYEDKPDFAKNYALAQAICEELEKICPGFTRPIREKTGRYNQHAGELCLLVEVGHNANTLQQAKNTIPYLAEAIKKVFDGENSLFG
ncbi:MAG: stage II sporulation protein P [Christensenellaceae bacterium]|nr:stage II sporulation protein P [Christensenellaceae bacterium]